MILKILLTGILIAVASFLWFLKPITANTVNFETDEMYWISTSDSLFRILKRDFGNKLWKEDYGFANLNGAKFLFGAGLLLTGRTDVNGLGTGSGTYYLWKDFTGPFPENHDQYPLLRYARMYSSLYTVGGVILVLLCTILLTRSLLSGIAASVVMMLHPVTVHVATHALADGMFLFFQMLLLFLILLGRQEKLKTLWIDICTGIAFAWLVSVKMNGFLFAPVILLLSLPSWSLRDWQDTNEYAQRLIRIFASAFGMFLLLHPNFFFYPAYSLLQIYRDRVWITMNHIGYFSANNPEHVTLAYGLRLASLARHVFRGWMGPVTIVSLLPLAYRLVKRAIPRAHALWILTIIVSGIVILAYTVFDEQRYYYPLVPLMSVLIGISIRLVRPVKAGQLQ